MARSKNLASKLAGQPEARPGWRDTIASNQPQLEPEPPVQPVDTLVRKTYLLTPDLISHIETLADNEQVGVNELVRFLLSSAVEQVKAKQLRIPTKPGKRRITH